MGRDYWWRGRGRRRRWTRSWREKPRESRTECWSYRETVSQTLKTSVGLPSLWTSLNNPLPTLAHLLIYYMLTTVLCVNKAEKVSMRFFQSTTFEIDIRFREKGKQILRDGWISEHVAVLRLLLRWITLRRDYTINYVAKCKFQRSGGACLIHSGVREKHQVSEIDWSQPRHATAFWWCHKELVTSHLTALIKWPICP